MLQLHSVYSLYNRHKTLTGSSDPTCANGTNKPHTNIGKIGSMRVCLRQPETVTLKVRHSGQESQKMKKKFLKLSQSEPLTPYPTRWLYNYVAEPMGCGN